MDKLASSLNKHFFKDDERHRASISAAGVTGILFTSCLLLSACQSSTADYRKSVEYLTYADYTYGKDVKSGVPTTLVRPATFGEDCSSGRRPDIKVLVPPSNGRLSFQNGRDYQNLEAGHPRFKCRSTLMDSRRVIYRSNPGFRGQDATVFTIIFGPGRTRTETVILQVK